MAICTVNFVCAHALLSGYKVSILVTSFGYSDELYDFCGLLADYLPKDTN